MWIVSRRFKKQSNSPATYVRSNIVFFSLGGRPRDKLSRTFGTDQRKMRQHGQPSWRATPSFFVFPRNLCFLALNCTGYVLSSQARDVSCRIWPPLPPAGNLLGLLLFPGRLLLLIRRGGTGIVFDNRVGPFSFFRFFLYYVIKSTV